MLRSPRWTPLLLIAALLTVGAFGALACGGDEEPPPTTATTAPPGGDGGSDTTEAMSSDPFAALIGTTLEVTEETPPEVSDAIEQRRPLVLLFYVPGNVDDAQVLDSLKKLESTYSDVTFVYYDYKVPSAYGGLGQALQVNYPPQAVFIDTRGVIQDVTSGYVDEATLNQAVVNIRQG